MSRSPDFILRSSEGYGLERPRACYFIRRMASETRDDYMLVRIEPPLTVRRNWLRREVLSEVLLAARHAGYTLFPPAEYPAYVHVARFKVPLSSDRVRQSDLESIAWAELYPYEEELE